MNLVIRTAVALAFALPACSVADANVDEVIAMSDGGDQRVLGKRAFDSAAAGYAPFERLSTEAPRRTFTRASEHLDVLERDLERMRAHTSADALAAELVHAEELVRAARGAIAASEDVETIPDAEVDSLVALVAEAQGVLDAVREDRIHTSA